MARTSGTTWAKRALVLPVAALLLAGLGACGGNDDTADQAADPANPAGGAPAIAIGEPAPDGVPRGDFLSTAVSDGGEPKKLVAGTKIAMTFADGQVRASAGCNSMSGPVTFVNNTIVVTELAQTDMGCPGDGRYEQDQWVSKFLTARPTYSYDGTSLDLKTAQAQIVLGPKESVQPDLPLEGTRWDVTHVTQGPAKGNTDPNAAVSAGMAPEKAYLEFAGGKVTGNDGCNTLTGTATVKGDTITFGPIATTKMACPGVQNDGVVSALSGDVTWRIDYDVLTLTNAQGAGLQLSAHRNASDLPLNTGDGDGGSDTVTPPCCKPMVGEDGANGSSGSGSSGVGAAPSTAAPTQVNPAGPADAPPGY